MTPDRSSVVLAGRDVGRLGPKPVGALHAALTEVAGRHCVMAPAVTVAWLARRPESLLIPGAGSVAEVTDQCARLGLNLDQAELDRLDDMYLSGPTVRTETGAFA